MSKFLTATAAQMDSIRINLHRAIRNLKRRSVGTLDLKDAKDERIKKLKADLADLEEQYTRRFLND